jgi:hypothetical protein
MLKECKYRRLQCRFYSVYIKIQNYYTVIHTHVGWQGLVRLFSYYRFLVFFHENISPVIQTCPNILRVMLVNCFKFFKTFEYFGKNTMKRADFIKCSCVSSLHYFESTAPQLSHACGHRSLYSCNQIVFSLTLFSYTFKLAIDSFNPKAGNCKGPR